jgi:two-component system phosphate regulon sensor histidine kinase PhoR
MASILSLWISRRISKPLEAMKKGADRFAAEDLDYRLPIANTEEMADLSEAMNRMAQELRRRMVKITEQHNEIESILASMFEGLIALDNEVRIINVNRAAQEILGISWNPQANSDLLGLVRNPGFEQLIKEIASTEALIEKDLSLFRPEEKIIHINGSPIYSSDGNRSGSLLILNDVTHLRRLENIRQDFAANVSHELKTPLTAVKGFVETLIHGDLEKTDEAKRFLTIIAKHVNRLEAIVEDLLMLARIEQGKEATRIGKQKHPVQEVLKKAVELRKSEAHAKGIKIELTGDSTLWMKMDILLFEQAVANLIDNAIKYSPDGSVVRVESRMEGSELKLLFQDEGIGIEKKHIPRIFERFYRVDKARSRKLGGTGLGLAIVKHIVQAHGGRIYVESIPGKGSTFTLLFPASEVEISTSKSNSFI